MSDVNNKDTCSTCVKWSPLAPSSTDGFCTHGVKSKAEFYERVIPMTARGDTCPHHKSAVPA